MAPMEERVTLGRTLNFATSVADYLASAGWVLKIALVPRAGGSTITLTSTAEGDDHRFQVSAATTGAWAAGTYDWESYVEKAGELYAVSRGTTVVAAVGARSSARIALDAANDALLTFNPTVRRYSIAGREMEFADRAELVAYVQFLESQVAREENAERISKGLAGYRQVFVRLGRA